MAQFKRIFYQDLTKKRIIRHCEDVVFGGDNLSDKIGVYLYDNGEPYAGGGTVSGTVINSRGQTVPITTGEISGNLVTVTLEEAALAVPGIIGVYVKLTSGQQIATVLGAMFTAMPTETNQAIDPGTIIPSVSQLITDIETARDSIPPVYTELLAAVAPTFSASTAYTAGSYVWQGGNLYRFTADHAAGSWTGTDAAAAVLGSDVSNLKSALTNMTTAAIADEGKALKAKTVTNGRVTEWEFGEAGGSLTATQANLLLTILREGVYGSDQEANIELLRKALMDIAPVSISAVLESTPLVGLYYSDLEFTVTATFDDESTMIVDGYRIATPGTVVSGSNTVTVAYRGVSTNVTFTASSEQTYTISYSLTDVDASNKDYLIIAGERYETTLSVEDDEHYIGSVVVTMGGVDITSTAYTSGTQTIMITEVTGNVSITASAEAYIYMDDLLFTRDGGFSNCNGYPNESTSEQKIIGGNYYYAPFVAEYPALHDCVVHWKITNVTENDLALENYGFGSLDTYGNNIYGGSSAAINAFNCVKADNLSHKLTAGESLEGDVSVKSGWSLCFICKYEDFASFGIELVGSYEQNMFDGYAEIAPTQATAPNFGTYRTVNYYSDDGNTLIKAQGGYPAAIKTNIEPGTYDVYYRTKAEDVTIPNVRNIFAIFGGMKQNTDTDVYFAGGSDYANGCNIWFHTQFVITENDMTLVAAIQYFGVLTANDPKLSILYKKVVTE